MKTIRAFLFLAVIACHIEVSAQQVDKKDLIPNQFGIKAGINASQFYGEGPLASDENQSIFGYHGGVYARLMLNNSFAIQPELLYSTKGNVSPSTSETGSIKISAQYIILDAVFKYYINKTVNFHIGPEIGYLWEAQTKFDFDPQDDNEVYINEAFNQLDYGMVIGSEIHLNEKLSLGLRYNPSFSEVGVKKGGWDLTNTKNTALLFFGTFGF